MEGYAFLFLLLLTFLLYKVDIESLLVAKVSFKPSDVVGVCGVKLLNRDFTCTQYDSDIKSNRQTNLEQKRIVPLYHY